MVQWYSVRDGHCRDLGAFGFQDRYLTVQITGHMPNLFAWLLHKSMETLQLLLFPTHGPRCDEVRGDSQGQGCTRMRWDVFGSQAYF